MPPTPSGKVRMERTCPWPGCGRVLAVTVSKQGKGIGSQYLASNMASHVGAHERRAGFSLRSAVADPEIADFGLPSLRERPPPRGRAQPPRGTLALDAFTGSGP